MRVLIPSKKMKVLSVMYRMLFKKQFELQIILEILNPISVPTVAVTM